MRIYPKWHCNCGDNGIDSVRLLLQAIFGGTREGLLIPEATDEHADAMIAALVRVSRAAMTSRLPFGEGTDPFFAYTYGALDASYPFHAAAHPSATELGNDLGAQVIAVFEAHADDAELAAVYGQ